MLLYLLSIPHWVDKYSFKLKISMAILGQFRGDLLSEWERVNPVIHDREFVLVKETVDGPWTAYKVGDGVNKFSDLPYGSNI